MYALLRTASPKGVLGADEVHYAQLHTHTHTHTTGDTKDHTEQPRTKTRKIKTSLLRVICPC